MDNFFVLLLLAKGMKQIAKLKTIYERKKKYLCILDHLLFILLFTVTVLYLILVIMFEYIQ